MDLPNELLECVLWFLELEDLSRCARVSAKFCAIASSENLWRSHFEREWGPFAVHLVAGISSWRQRFVGILRSPHSLYFQFCRNFKRVLAGVTTWLLVIGRGDGLQTVSVKRSSLTTHFDQQLFYVEFPIILNQSSKPISWWNDPMVDITTELVDMEIMRNDQEIDVRLYGSPLKCWVWNDILGTTRHCEANGAGKSLFSGDFGVVLGNAVLSTTQNKKRPVMELRAKLCLHGALLLHNYSTLRSFAPIFCPSQSDLGSMVTAWSIFVELTPHSGSTVAWHLYRSEFPQPTFLHDGVHFDFPFEETWTLQDSSYMLSIMVLNRLSGTPLLFTAQSQRVGEKSEKLEFVRMYWGMNFEFSVTVRPNKMALSVPNYWGWLAIGND